MISEGLRDLATFLFFSLVAIIESIVQFFIPAKYKMKSIENEIVLITGGGGGLGRLLALRMAKLGAVIVIWDINKTSIDETVKLVQTAGGTCYGYVCNVCDRKDVYKKAAIVKEVVGIVTILINNAGVSVGQKLMDIPDEQIIRTMEVNAISHFWTVKAFLPGMIAYNKGHVVSIASLAGHVGVIKLVDYCASKFAAVGFDVALRMELEFQGYNINTTVVCPYFIHSTGMFMQVMNKYVSKLSVNDVADRIITAIRCNEKQVIIPGYFQILLSLKELFPWTCTSMLINYLVPDVSHEVPQKSISRNPIEDMPPKVENGGVIQQQLTRLISSSERKP